MRSKINIIARAWITVFAIVSIALVAAFVLSRPASVNFKANFKCKNFRPGFPIGVTLAGCERIKFEAENLTATGLFVLPGTNGESPSDPTLQTKHNEIAVRSVCRPEVVSATLDNDDIDSISLRLPSDSVIELPMAKKLDPFGIIRITGPRIGMDLKARRIAVKMPFDPDYSSFLSESNEPFGEFVLDGDLDEQGGIADIVSLAAKDAKGQISISGYKDDVSGAWAAIDSLEDISPVKTIIKDCKLSADDVTSCSLDINGEATEISHSVDSLQFDIVSADIRGIKIYQDSSEAYIELNIFGTAQSLRVDNEEQIKTKLEKLLSHPTYQAGFLGVLMSFMLLAGGVTLKRALETLADSWLPEKR